MKNKPSEKKAKPELTKIEKIKNKKLKRQNQQEKKECDLKQTVENLNYEKPNSKKNIKAESAKVEKFKKLETPKLSPDIACETNGTDRNFQRINRRAIKEKLKRTLFVGNCPPSTTRNQIRKLFNSLLAEDSKVSDCRVDTVRLRCCVPVSGTGKASKKRAVIHGESAGVSKTLVAYVVLSSVSGVKTALSLNGHLLIPDKGSGENLGNGSHIRVDRVSSLNAGILKNSVFVGNLPFDCSEEEVRQALSSIGSIVSVRLIRDRETGAVKGFGYAQFADPSIIPLALRASETVNVRNRPIRILECRTQSGNELDTSNQKNTKQNMINPKILNPKEKRDYFLEKRQAKKLKRKVRRENEQLEKAKLMN